MNMHYITTPIFWFLSTSMISEDLFMLNENLFFGIAVVKKDCVEISLGIILLIYKNKKSTIDNDCASMM